MFLMSLFAAALRFLESVEIWAAVLREPQVRLKPRCTPLGIAMVKALSLTCALTHLRTALLALRMRGELCAALFIADIRERWRTEPLARTVGTDWLLTGGAPNRMIFEPEKIDRASYGNYGTSVSIRQLFASSLADAAKQALALQKDGGTSRKTGVVPDRNADRAKRWLITHYPLFGSLLAQFEIIEDADICRRMDISIAAIWVNLGEIYLNPVRLLTIEQSKFVLAHEVLHAGLCHSARRRGRDAYLWNVACDFVINDWLVQMQIGQPPTQLGLLYDEELRGLSAEEIYLRLAADLRIRKRLCTMRGNDVDMIDDNALLRDGTFSDREEFYRRALAQGLDFHQAYGCGRGGTVRQAAVSLLATRTDFPKECSVLIITDGMFEETLSISFDHAFLLPPGRHLPFRTHQPMFYMNA